MTKFDVEFHPGWMKFDVNLESTDGSEMEV